MIKKKINIAVIGLGQIGNYLLNELNTKKNDIELKTGKKIQIVAISAKNKNKKRKFKINKKIFYKEPLNIFKKKKIDILFEAIGQSDGISKQLFNFCSIFNNCFSVPPKPKEPITINIFFITNRIT